MALAAEARRRMRVAALQRPALPEEQDYLVLPLLPTVDRASALTA